MPNLQNVNGKAKAYQVRQFLKLIRRSRAEDQEGEMIMRYPMKVFYREEDAVREARTAEQLWLETAKKKRKSSHDR